MNNFKNSTMPDNMYAFSMTSLMDIMKEFSDLSIPRVVIGYILMVRTLHFLLLACRPTFLIITNMISFSPIPKI
mgnify:FL=1